MNHPKRLLIALLLIFSICFTGIASFSQSTPVYAEGVTCGDGSPAPDNDTTKCTTTNGDFSTNPCGGGTFLGFPKWYKYLPSQRYTDMVTDKPACMPVLSGLSSVWKIVAAVIELLLRLAALIAIGFVVYGGITYTLSQGSPDKTKQALKTIISALVGLLITIISTALVTFVAGRF